MELFGEKFSRELLIVGMAGLSTFFIILFVWRSLLEPKPASDRMKDIKQRREALREGLLSSGKKEAGSQQLKRSSLGVMRRFVDKLDLLRGDVARQVANQLASAGLRSKDALVAFVFFKLALPFIGGAVGMIGVNIFMSGDTPFMQRIVLALVVAISGFFLPDMYVKNRIKARQKDLRQGLPDALDLLVVCAQAGLSLDSAIARVAREIGFSSPAVGEEFSLTALELGFLPERKQALENLKDRTGLKDIRSVVSTLTQAEKYGTPLAYALRVLSAEFRRDRMMRAEEKAAALPAIMTLPLALFILPVLFMVIIGPAIIQAMITLKS